MTNERTIELFGTEVATAVRKEMRDPILWNGTWVGDMPAHPLPDSLRAMLTTPLPEGGHYDHHHHHDEGDDMDRGAQNNHTLRQALSLPQ